MLAGGGRPNGDLSLFGYIVPAAAEGRGPGPVELAKMLRLNHKIA